MNKRLITALNTINTHKIVTAFVAVASVAAVGATTMANAAPQGIPTGTPTSKQDCRDHWQQLGFKNQGQCISYFEHHQQHGYGGDQVNE